MHSVSTGPSSWLARWPPPRRRRRSAAAPLRRPSFLAPRQRPGQRGRNGRARGRRATDGIDQPPRRRPAVALTFVSTYTASPGVRVSQRIFQSLLPRLGRRRPRARDRRLYLLCSTPAASVRPIATTPARTPPKATSRHRPCDMSSSIAAGLLAWFGRSELPLPVDRVPAPHDAVEQPRHPVVVVSRRPKVCGA